MDISYKGKIIPSNELYKHIITIDNVPDNYIKIVENNSRLFIIPNFTQNYYDELSKLDLIKERTIIVYGKECKQRRDSKFYSNESKGYKFSGQTTEAEPLINEIMQEIMRKVNIFLGTNFNGILVNRYVDGTKYIGPHSDDERGLDKKQNLLQVYVIIMKNLIMMIIALGHLEYAIKRQRKLL